MPEKTFLFGGGFGNGFGNNGNIISCFFGGRSEETSEVNIDPGNYVVYKKYLLMYISKADNF